VAADDSPSDAALIERANRGDAGAFEALYQRHRDWVAALAFRFTGNRDDALDVLQETFAYFFAKFPGFELTAALTTFLYPAVKHLALTKRRARRPTVDVDELADVLPAPEISGSASDFVRLVSQLPAAQREVVLMRFADDLSLPQIAAALSVPLGTVKSRLHTALATLKKFLRG
jgi:RNA polymerase sigma-70 factor, ECF subfamily